MSGCVLDPESLLSRLWAGKEECSMTEDELRGLCAATRDVIAGQPMLLVLEGPVCIGGDIHGQLSDLKRLFELCGPPAETDYLFLGDYVDRGLFSLETISMLFAYKLKYPTRFFLLRGNHESAAINRIYGFYDECRRRFSLKLWRCFTDTFNYLPVAALVGNRILCMHGGLSPRLTAPSDIAQLRRPTDVPDAGMLCDLLWSDPDGNVRGWAGNDRGVSVTFGPDVIVDFLQRNDLDLVCRAHQVVEQGYEFFAQRGLVTLFSAPNYCGEFENDGAVMHVSGDLVCSFRVLKHRKEPEQRQVRQRQSLR